MAVAKGMSERDACLRGDVYEGREKLNCGCMAEKE